MRPGLSDYRARLTTAAAAVRLIPSGAKVVMGLGVSQPPALLGALADRAATGDISDVRLYYLLSMAHAGATVLRHDLRARIRPMSLFHGANERALDRLATLESMPPVDILPCSFSNTPRLLTDVIGADTLLTTVAPVGEDGWFSLGTNADYALAVAQTAARVIVEVNSAMPRVRGRCAVHVSRVSAIVEHDTPLLEVPRIAARPEDEAIGTIIAELARDGDCLQMGIGAVPDAVCAALRGHRHLGIHTELMTPGLVELMQAGVVDNSRKLFHTGVSVFTFAMGDAALYRFLNDNPTIEAHPVDYTNDPAVIARNANMLSINSTLQIDLEGACNSEFLDGRQYSAAGGQLDFVRGASASPGGRSIIACHSTAANGTVSRIVSRLDGPVTTPRNDVHIVATEFGWADLRGKSLAERGLVLIAVAHPAFRESLSRLLRDRA